MVTAASLASSRVALQAQTDTLTMQANTESGNLQSVRTRANNAVALGASSRAAAQTSLTSARATQAVVDQAVAENANVSARLNDNRNEISTVEAAVRAQEATSQNASR